QRRKLAPDFGAGQTFSAKFVGPAQQMFSENSLDYYTGPPYTSFNLIFGHEMNTNKEPRQLPGPSIHCSAGFTTLRKSADARAGRSLSCKTRCTTQAGTRLF